MRKTPYRGRERPTPGRTPVGVGQRTYRRVATVCHWPKRAKTHNPEFASFVNSPLQDGHLSPTLAVLKKANPPKGGDAKPPV